MSGDVNVLSLFDGISCGRLALQRANVAIDKYYSIETNEYAIKIANNNYPQDKEYRLGDVRNIKGRDLPQIDLLIACSPCQGFSVAGKRLNFKDERSDLFFEFVRLLREVKPKYFLLENVVMKKECQDIISDILKVQPVKINSALVSAQNRNRLYWTNIPNITQPQDKNIKLNDVLDTHEFRELKPFCFKLHNGVAIKDILKTVCDEKANCLTTNKTHTKQYYLNKEKNKMRNLSVNEYEKLQTLPIDYTVGVSNTQRYKSIGNAWTVDVIAHIFKRLAEDLQKKQNTIKKR
ncbi:DNA cytosine methyltransferase [Campylobacter pinnipediorum]|uniref:DNA cytosine methyltransferase n=1 Tax=Campylobacter pinnipediorum TaxID=1965231 RepID=UPI000995BB4F|nr:DNA (cytosine-5-)-methyltransferase [Campylobacter pinnipediorum]AQW82869.1 cytosine-specific DNA methyltransferase [Campylobacter pinnipediorum subsp. pinnipediorum]